MGRRKVNPISRMFPYIRALDCYSCWEWMGAKDLDGYGLFKNAESKQTRVHRFMLELASGEKVPHGMVVMHSCDNPSCVNPDHLSVGTPQDNTVDMVNKGRNPDYRGEKNPMSRLTTEQIVSIRSDSRGNKALAKIHGTTANYIAAIKRGDRVWAVAK